MYFSALRLILERNSFSLLRIKNKHYQKQRILYFTYTTIFQVVALAKLVIIKFKVSAVFSFVEKITVFNIR